MRMMAWAMIGTAVFAVAVLVMLTTAGSERRRMLTSDPAIVERTMVLGICIRERRVWDYPWLDAETRAELGPIIRPGTISSDGPLLPVWSRWRGQGPKSTGDDADALAMVQSLVVSHAVTATEANQRLRRDGFPKDPADWLSTP